MNPTIPTPRTDAEAMQTRIDAANGVTWYEPVSAQLARQLERELAVVEEALAEVLRCGNNPCSACRMAIIKANEKLAEMWKAAQS